MSRCHCHLASVVTLSCLVVIVTSNKSSRFCCVTLMLTSGNRDKSPGSPVSHMTAPGLLCITHATPHHDEPVFPVVGCALPGVDIDVGQLHGSLADGIKADTGTPRPIGCNSSPIMSFEIRPGSIRNTCASHLRRLWLKRAGNACTFQDIRVGHLVLPANV